MGVKRGVRVAGALWLLAAAPAAKAVEMEFYTYGGFGAMRDAFTRLGLVFSDYAYFTLLISMIVLGAVYAAYAATLRAATGGGFSPMGGLVTVFTGATFFIALVVPTGTIHLYDPQGNEYEPIGGVPDAVVLTAGLLNKIERLVVDITETGSAYPYADEAGGISFNLIYRATAQWNDVNDYYLTDSIGEYFADCSPTALSSPAYDVDLNEVKRDTTDQMATLAKFTSTSDYTTWYDSSNKSGVTMTCEEAWNNHIQPALADQGTWDPLLQNTCAAAGFNVSSMQQLNACKERLAVANDFFGVGGQDAIHLIRNSYLASAIAEKLEDDNPDVAAKAIANKKVMTEGVSVAAITNEWIPTMRAVMWAVSLGMIPFIALFLVTPLAKKAGFVTFGLLTFNTLWGVSDVVTHQMAMDGAQRAFERIQDLQMGLDSIWLAPDAALKALSGFGNARSQSLMVAVLISATLFGFSAYALASQAGTWQREMDQASEEGGDRAMNPTDRAEYTEDLARVQGTEGAMAAHGFEGMSAHNALEKNAGLHETEHALNQAAEAGMSPDQLAAGQGAASGGGDVGSLTGLQAMTAQRGANPNDASAVADTAQMISHVQQAEAAGSAEAKLEALTELGDGSFELGMERYTSFQAMQEVSQTATAADLAHEIQAQHEAETGEQLSEQEAFERVAQYGLADSYGRISATGGDPQVLADYVQENQQMGLARFEAMSEVLGKHGMTLEDWSGIEGTIDAHQGVGRAAALGELTPQEVAVGYEMDMMRHGMEGQALSNLAGEQYGGDSRAMLADLEETKAGQQFGQYMAVARAAEMIGANNTDAAVAMEGSNVSLSVGEEGLGEMARRLGPDGLGLLNASQLEAMRGQGGGVVTASFEAGADDPLAMRGYAGSDVAAHDSTTIDTSHHTDTSTRVSAGYHLDEQGIRDAVFGGPGQLSETMVAAQDDPSRMMEVHNRVQDMFGHTGEFSMSEREISQFEANLGFTVFGQYGSGPGAGWSYQDVDTGEARFDSLRGALEVGYERITDAADERARELATDPETGRLDQAAYHQHYGQIASERYAEFVEGLYGRVTAGAEQGAMEAGLVGPEYKEASEQFWKQENEAQQQVMGGGPAAAGAAPAGPQSWELAFGDLAQRGDGTSAEASREGKGGSSLDGGRGLRGSDPGSMAPR